MGALQTGGTTTTIPQTPSRTQPSPPSYPPRFHAFLLYLGYTAEAAREVRIMQFCHTLREFALEYRTCRDRVLQQQQKRATYRERNKTRGRMITEVGVPSGLDCHPCGFLLLPFHPLSPLQTEKFSGVAGETPSKPSVPVAVSSGLEEGDADSHATMKSLLASKPEDATHGRRSRGGTSGCWGQWALGPLWSELFTWLPQAWSRAAPQSCLQQWGPPLYPQKNLQAPVYPVTLQMRSWTCWCSQ